MLGSAVDGVERRRVERQAVVREDERAHRLAELGRARVGAGEPVRLEPLRQPLDAVVDVDAVDEQLHPAQRLRRGLRHVIARGHGCSQSTTPVEFRYRCRCSIASAPHLL